MRTWEEMTVVEQLQCLYSDYYKEVHGFRPRGIMVGEDWNNEEFLRAEFDKLDKVASVVFAEQERREQEAIEYFERSVNACLLSGAKDREQAIKWLVEAASANDVYVSGDMDYFCYLNGLPYGYFNKAI